MKGGRILEPEIIQHIACTPKATEENTPGRIGDLESLMISYSQVFKLLFCWGKNEHIQISNQASDDPSFIWVKLIHKWD